MDSNQQFHSGGGSIGIGVHSGTAMEARQAAQPVRQPELFAATEELKQEIDSLHGLLSNLEQRLSPVTRNLPSTNEKRGEAPDTSVPLANTLRGFSRDIAIARDRVTALLETIAL